jgi:gamma-glutamyltranspeptidase/glutathione hydrolase
MPRAPRLVPAAAVIAALACFLPGSVASAVQGSRYHEGVTGTAGVVATESPAAARVGRAVLARGGNAIDAAAATVFALGVARPQSCGIGGGGFMVYRSPDGVVRALDFRETAGAAMKADSLSGPGLHKTFTGHLTVGVPGTLAGMASALDRFGTLSLRDALAPAAKLANDGFRVPTSLTGAMARRAKDIALFPATAAQYLKNGAPYQPGEVLKQPDLAKSLRLIQDRGIGGGGFMVYRSPDGVVRALDFRETAGAAMKADSLSGPGLHKTFTGHLTVGVPGTLAGMASALDRFGTLSLRDALAPAAKLANDGFRVPTSLTGAMARRAKDIALFPATAAQYLKNGAPYQPGEVLKQPDLAKSLRLIQDRGIGALYGGELAHAIVRDMRAPRPATKDPGLLTVKDFKAYKPIWRVPVHTTYRGRDVYGAPPATSGGTTMLEMLNILEGFDLKAMGEGSAQAITAISEAQKIAWADRGAYLADPAFVRQPITPLLSKEYAAQRRAEIDLNKAKSFSPAVFPPTQAATARAAGEDFNKHGSTTHVSVVDARGGAVSVTCTIEQEFGSTVIAPGTGFLLNNELTDFSAPGTANEPAPGKRPRSSINPTIVVQDDHPILVAGAAGGSTIIMGPTLAVIDTIDFGMTLPQAVDAERFDDQGANKLSIEDTRIAPAVLAQLTAEGYTLSKSGEYGPVPRMQLAGLFPGPSGLATAVSDSRSDRGSLAVPTAVPPRRR